MSMQGDGTWKIEGKGKAKGVTVVKIQYSFMWWISIHVFQYPVIVSIFKWYLNAGYFAEWHVYSDSITLHYLVTADL